MTAADDLRRQTRPTTTRPFIVEFAGTPRAGKTTALKGLRDELQEHGYQVEVVEEQAAQSPVPNKRNPDFNVWTVASTVARMVTAVHTGKHVVLVDRGVFDALCWTDWHVRCVQLDTKEQAVIDRFLLTRSRTVDLVLLMTVSSSEAQARNGASGRGRAAGTIVGRRVLSELNRSINIVSSRHAGQFPLVHLDTTDLDRDATLARVLEAVSDRLTPNRAAGILRPSAAHEANGSSRPPAQPHGAATVDALAAPPTG